MVRGNSGVAIAAGVHWYLKYYCNASIAWGKQASGNQLSTVPPPAQLPLPAAERRVSPVKYRYAYNVCTFVSLRNSASTYLHSAPYWAFDSFAAKRSTVHCAGLHDALVDLRSHSWNDKSWRRVATGAGSCRRLASCWHFHYLARGAGSAGALGH